MSSTIETTQTYEAAAESFRENGYVILRGVLDAKELDDLREESIAQIEAGPDREPAGHFKSAPGLDGTPVFFRIESIFNKAIRNNSALLVQAHPAILGVVSRILPNGFVCWADALLWKGTSGGPGVGPHSAHQFGADFAHENMVVDVYVDESNARVGCLRVIPRSHKLSPEENLALLAQGWDAPGFIEVDMRPGDVLLHSEWMIHGSKPTGPLERTSRRVFYFAMMDPQGRMTGDNPIERRALAVHMRRTLAAAELRSDRDRSVRIVAPGFADDVAAITEDEALGADAAAC